MNSNASPGQLAAACADLRPGIALLALAYPEFTISEPVPGRNGPAWAVVRKDPAQPGLYAVVTPDLAELRDILARHASQQHAALTQEPDQQPGASRALPEADGNPFHATDDKNTRATIATAIRTCAGLLPEP